MSFDAARIAPIAVTINEAVRVTGISRAEIYRRLAVGQLSAVKSGRRTLVLANSIKAHFAQMPAATFRKP